MASRAAAEAGRFGQWPGLLATVAGFALTLAGLLQIVRSEPGAQWQLDLSSLISLGLSAALAACTVWTASLATGYRVQVAVALGVAMGLTADLLCLHGLSQGFQVRHGDHLELVFAGLATVGLLWAAVSGNRDGIRRGQRERLLHETDPLTGTLNRRGLIRQFERLTRSADGEGAPGHDDQMSVAMVDVNDLRAINDQGGHGEGDEHLRRIAATLRGALPPGGLLCRWGGDEFVVVALGRNDLRALLAPGALSVERPDATLPAYAVGAAVMPRCEPLERALALADEGMYEEKTRQYDERATLGRGTHVGFSTFGHFLESLDALDTILDIGLGTAADLACFESWLYVELGSPLQVTYHEQRPGDLPRGRVQFTLPDNLVVSAVAQRQETVWSSDYEQSVFAETALIRLKVKSIVAAPVKVDGDVKAVVALVSSARWQSASPQVRQLLETVASHLGHHLDRQEAYLNMQASVEAGITGMGVLLEMRDLETAGHTQRVVSLALQLGRAAGLDAETLTALRMGAYLHDVGKLAIPDAVLLKPGPLDTREWTLMKTHTEVGALMAARLPSLPQAALDVVLSHHERWDGRGYPAGLRGEGIPLLARIFSLCDVYDALTHVRPYKEAWTPQRARVELASQAGRQFDPDLTPLFLEQVVAVPEAGPAASAGRGIPEAGGPAGRAAEGDPAC